MTPVIAAFVRPVIPGAVKTRLQAALSPDRVATLYTAFIADCLDHAAATGFDGSLWVAGDPDHVSLRALSTASSWRAWPRLRQPEADLGARQRAALTWALARGDRALAVGTDAPSLPTALLCQACDALSRADVVFGPAADGGYYLVGVRGRIAPGFLTGVRWSSPHTLADTLASARACGYRPTLLPPFYDVDQPRDLVLLRTHLAVDPSAAPHTARLL